MLGVNSQRARTGRSDTNRLEGRGGKHYFGAYQKNFFLSGRKEETGKRAWLCQIYQKGDRNYARQFKKIICSR